MAKINAKELDGTALDWALAKTTGVNVEIIDGKLITESGEEFAPSKDQAFCKSILDGVDMRLNGDVWRVWKPDLGIIYQESPSKELAALRLFVSLECPPREKRGGEPLILDVPDELLESNEEVERPRGG
jgi:hypothetical protein